MCKSDSKFVYQFSGYGNSIEPITDKKAFDTTEKILFWKEESQRYVEADIIIGSKGGVFFEEDNNLGILDYSMEHECWVCSAILPKDSLQNIIETFNKNESLKGEQ